MKALQTNYIRNLHHRLLFLRGSTSLFSIAFPFVSNFISAVDRPKIDYFPFQGANDQTFSSSWHPTIKNLIVVCGRGHFSFWSFDPKLGTLTKNSAVFDEVTHSHCCRVVASLLVTSFSFFSFPVGFRVRTSRRRCCRCASPLPEMLSRATRLEHSPSGTQPLLEARNRQDT